MTISTAFEKEDLVYFIDTRKTSIAVGKVASISIDVRDTVTNSYCLSVKEKEKTDYIVKRESELHSTPNEIIEALKSNT